MIILITVIVLQVSQYVKSFMEAYAARQQSSSTDENVKAKKKHGKHR